MPQLTASAIALSTHIGQTPLYDFSSWVDNPQVKVFGKLEWHQLGGSVKARAAYNIILQAILNKELSQRKTIVDATSGNTGIALAAIGAKLGIPTHLFMPANATPERVLTLRALGAKLTLTDPDEGTDGAQIHVRALVESDPEHYFYADQYGNPHNWQAHFLGTADEIWNQTQQQVTHFTTALGTSGSFVGTTRKLKHYRQEVNCIALQPDVAEHEMEGWKYYAGAKIIPKIFDSSVPDSTRIVSTQEAHSVMLRAAKEQGLLISPSSAGNLAGALTIAKELDHGVVVTLLPDSAERYGDIVQSLFGAE